MKNNRAGAGTSVLVGTVAIAAVFLGVAGCASATANPADPAQTAKSVAALQSADKGRLTGYASATVSGGASGPISVAPHGASVARLDQLVNGRQKWTGASCEENIQLYQLDFTQIAGAKRSLKVGCVN